MMALGIGRRIRSRQTILVRSAIHHRAEPVHVKEPESVPDLVCEGGLEAAARVVVQPDLAGATTDVGASTGVGIVAPFDHDPARLRLARCWSSLPACHLEAPA